MLSLNKKWFIGTVIVIATLFVSLTLFGQDQTKKSDSVKQTNYGFSKVVNLGYEEAIEKVTEELKKEGFGVLTEIDVKATLKKKLDVDFKPYNIVAAINPIVSMQAVKNDNLAEIAATIQGKLKKVIDSL